MIQLLKTHEVLNSGANGVVTKINYEQDKIKTVVVLKESLKKK